MRNLLLSIALLCASAFGQIGVPSPIPNDTVTGTTQNKLFKYNTTGSATSAIITATSDTTGAVGVCADGCGASGKMTPITLGQGTLAIDNTAVPNDYVTLSSTAAGSGHDFGSSCPTNGAQVVGTIFGAGGSAGNYSVHFQKGLCSASSASTAPLCQAIGSSDTLSQTVASGIGTFATVCAVPATAISGVGQTLHVFVRGTYTTSNTAAPLLNIQVNGGGTSAICSHTSNQAIGLSQTSVWFADCYIHIVTTGAPGTATTWGNDWANATAGGSGSLNKMYNNPSTVSFTTNSTQNITIGQTATMVTGESATLTDLIVLNY